jgi:hypothetical protein
MPKEQVEINRDNNTVKVVKSNDSLRAWLALGTLAGTWVGHMIIKQGCKTAGKIWAILWFIAALVIMFIINTLILSGREHIKISEASQVLRLFDKGGK